MRRESKFVYTTILLIASLFSLSGCTSPYVQAQTLYSSRKNLASYSIDTPDPEKETRRLSQEIWVQWRTPERYDDLALDTTIRFEDNSEIHNRYPLSGRFGDFLIKISPEDYQTKGSILSYRLLLQRGEETIFETKHKMWVDPIVVEK